MSFKNFFAQSIRGWLPEEPKMPKSKLRKTLPPIAVFVAATTIFSLFSSSVFVPNQTVVVMPPPLAVSSAVNTSFVELGGFTETPNDFILVLSDGNHIFSDNLKLTFFLDEGRGGKCTVTLAVECDEFSREASVEGCVVNGNLVIDSKRSLFLINPDVNPGNIVLTETDGWKLDACVSSKTRKLSTAIDPYEVNSVFISSDTSRTEKGWPLKVDLGYDHNTGFLVFSGYSLSDVLLEKVGIDLLLGGSLKLVSFSKHFNIDVVEASPPSLLSYVPYFLLPSLVILSVVVYLLHRKWKRRQTGAHNLLEFRDNTGQSCEVGD